jgi:Holliday junction DNA helicase RuvA
MIYSVRGVLIEKNLNSAVIDTGAMAFEVSISATTYKELPDTGEKAHLYTHFVMREDAVNLYGFKNLEEKKLFLLLITISKVGPKLALAILSGMDTNKFMNAVIKNDAGLISTIPGIGKKTAERIIVELKDKFGKIVAESAPEGVVAGADDVISALGNLGYSKQECQKAVAKIYKTDSDFEELFRLALKELSQ